MGEELDALQIVPRYAPRTRPLPIPGVDAFDAPVTCLEINQFWVSHLLGALEVLDQPDAWLGSDQEIFLARQQIREIMLALTLGNCEGGPSMFDVRQSENEPCLLEKTVDGLTWTPFAMLDLCAQATTPPPSSTYDDLRENPVTGELEFSLDDGVTWTDVPVPPGEPPTNPWAPARSPSPGATTEERRCNAATRAAMNLSEMYRQTYGAIGAGLLTGLSQFSSFLQELNNLLAGIVWGTYFDIWQALGFQQSFEPTQYAAAAIDGVAYDELVCLLYENATVGNQGVVSFDFGAVRDNVISELGINPGTAVWTHLNYLQEAGLNRLGEVGFGGDMGACWECNENEWFALGGYGLSGLEISRGTGGAACNDSEPLPYYDSALDRIMPGRCQNGPDKQAAMWVTKTFPESTFTSIRLHYLIAGNTAGIGVRVYFYNNGSLVRQVSNTTNTPNTPPTERNQTWTFAPTVADEIRIRIFSLTIAVSTWPDNQLLAIEATGSGIGPF